jgi:glyoxylase I family protein
MLGVVKHASGEPGRFDERRIGMDHVALSVPAEELPSWRQRLDDAGVPYTPPAPSALGEPLIVLRDPDNIQLQIYGRQAQ